MAIMQATAARTSPAPQVEVKVPTVTVYTDGKSQVIQIPKSHDEMRALMSQRDALTDQLEELKDQRKDLIEELQSAPAAAKSGMELQLTDLSTQIVDVQRQVNLVNREIAGASPELIAMTHDPPEDEPPDINETFGAGVGVGALGGIVLATVVFFLNRLIRRRFVRDDASHGRMIAADSERLKRLENGIDAMAVEIERISEGQRFVTKLMSESRGLESTPR